MEALDDTLCERVDELIRSRRRQPFLSTMGAQAAIGELIARNEELEKAIREVALEVRKLAAAQEGGSLMRTLERATDR